MGDSRVKVAGTGTHGDAFKRGKTHAGVDGFSVFDGGEAAAIAEVAGDNAGGFRVVFPVADWFRA